MHFSSFVLAALAGCALAHSPVEIGPHRLEKRATTGSASVITTCTKPNTWAITLDDGPYDFQPEIRAAAKKYGAKLTFFVNGNNWRCIYSSPLAEELQRTFKDGHAIGNHLWSHPDAATLNQTAFYSEVRRVDTALGKILGVKPNLFRFPFGSYNANNLRWLKQLGYPRAFDWDTDSKDADGASVSSQKTVYNKAIADGKPHISLNHETHKTTVTESLPYLMKKLQAKGIKMVTVDQCFGGSRYRSNSGKLGVRDSTWTC